MFHLVPNEEKNHYALQVSIQAKKLSKSYGKQSAGGNESKNV